MDAQQARIRSYAAMRGFELVSIYREEGISAKIPLKKRPEGMRLVEFLSRKRAKHVIAVKLDRLFRNAADALDQTAEWDRARCSLHIIDMGGSAIDTASAMGRMFFTMAAAFAEMERNLISERTKAALSFKRASRTVYCNVTPLGFNRDGDKLTENAEEMQTVHTICRLRSQGRSMQFIADRLNESGASTKRGGKWHAVTIQKILRVHETSTANMLHEAS